MKCRNKGTTTMEWNTVKLLSVISEGTMEGKTYKCGENDSCRKALNVSDL
jgi:hypothetical protein